MPAETEVRDMPQGVAGELRIGILPSFSAGVAASAIQRTRDLLLGVRIVTHSAPLQPLYADLSQGRLHVVLSHAELPVDLNLVEVVAVYEGRVGRLRVGSSTAGLAISFEAEPGTVRSSSSIEGTQVRYRGELTEPGAPPSRTGGHALGLAAAARHEPHCRGVGSPHPFA